MLHFLMKDAWPFPEWAGAAGQRTLPSLHVLPLLLLELKTPETQACVHPLHCSYTRGPSPLLSTGRVVARPHPACSFSREGQKVVREVPNCEFSDQSSCKKNLGAYIRGSERKGGGVKFGRPSAEGPGAVRTKQGYQMQEWREVWAGWLGSFPRTLKCQAFRLRIPGTSGMNSRLSAGPSMSELCSKFQAPPP